MARQLSESDYERAARCGEAILNAIKLAREAEGNSEIVQFLLDHARKYDTVANMDASALMFPKAVGQGELILSYLWSYIEAKSVESIAADIKWTIDSELGSAQLPYERERYELSE